ncbi:MAG: oligosaccharide flippase family protein [Phycisphaerae bacterium]
MNPEQGVSVGSEGRPVARQGAERSVIVRNVLANWIWYLLVVASGFVLPRFIDRSHGAELLGVWDFSWSLVAYISLLALAVSSAVQRYVAKYRAIGDWDALNATTNTCLVLLLASSVVGLAVTVGLAALVPRLLPAAGADAMVAARRVVLVLGLCCAIQMPGGVFNAVVTGYERFDVFNIIRGIRDFLLLVVMIALLFAGYGIVALACAKLCAEMLGYVAMLAAARRLCPQLLISLRLFRWDVAKQMVGFGGKSILQDLARSGVYQGNSLLLGYFLGPAALAVFSRQRALVMHVMRFIKQYAHVFIPSSSALYARRDVAALQTLVIQSSKYALYVTLPIMLVLLIMGDLLVQVWMGAAYRAHGVLAILTVGHLLSVPQQGTYMILVGMGKHALPALADLAAMLVSIGLCITILGLSDGSMAGVAVAIAVPVALSGGVFVPLYACRVLDLSVRRYVRGTLPGPALTAIPFVGAILPARLLFDGSPWLALGVGLGVGGSVLAITYWRWVLPPSLKSRITHNVLQLGRRTADEEGKAPVSSAGS